MAYFEESMNGSDAVKFWQSYIICQSVAKQRQNKLCSVWTDFCYLKKSIFVLSETSEEINTLTNDQENEAAVKIQASFRGHMVRKTLRQ